MVAKKTGNTPPKKTVEIEPGLVLEYHLLFMDRKMKDVIRALSQIEKNASEEDPDSTFESLDITEQALELMFGKEQMDKADEFYRNKNGYCTFEDFSNILNIAAQDNAKKLQP